MRVLFISSFLLFADSRSGAAKRLYYFARMLARECELSLVCLDAGEEAASFDAAMSPVPRFLQIGYQRGPLDKLREPFDVPRYLSAATRDEVGRFVAAEPFDVVFCAFGFALSLVQLPALAGAKRVVYLEDDFAFEVYRERMRKAPLGPRKLHMALRWRQAEAFYRRLMPRVCRFISISEEEAAVVRRKFPHLEVRIVGYGIPLEEFPMLRPPNDRRALGFIGNYIHPSNTDAMRHFLEHWWPALRGATMRIAGKNLPASVADAAAGSAGVTCRDNVPDLARFYAEIAIFVNPIVSQRGLRTKLVEAAAFGRPIISTGLGAEGLEALPMAIADSPEAFVAAFAKLQDAGYYWEMALTARAVVEREFSIEAIGRVLLASLEEVSAAR